MNYLLEYLSDHYLQNLVVLLAVALAWPLAAHAQQKTTPVIGVLGTSTTSAHLWVAFR